MHQLRYGLELILWPLALLPKIFYSGFYKLHFFAKFFDPLLQNLTKFSQFNSSNTLTEVLENKVSSWNKILSHITRTFYLYELTNIISHYYISPSYHFMLKISAQKRWKLFSGDWLYETGWLGLINYKLLKIKEKY